jgi:DMSO/TMAO reductase YedYZ molybdopterin-dependent catalytic subunit
VTKDIHCVTSWSKLDTVWEGVLIEDILADAELDRPTDFVLAHCYDNYSTNVPLTDLLSGKAMVALSYAGKPLSRDHGGRRVF